MKIMIAAGTNKSLPIRHPKPFMSLSSSNHSPSGTSLQRRLGHNPDTHRKKEFPVGSLRPLIPSGTQYQVGTMRFKVAQSLAYRLRHFRVQNVELVPGQILSRFLAAELLCRPLKNRCPKTRAVPLAAAFENGPSLGQHAVYLHGPFVQVVFAAPRMKLLEKIFAHHRAMPAMRFYSVRQTLNLGSLELIAQV